MQKSDEQLISDCLFGDADALQELIGRYLRPIYGFIFRLVKLPEAEDITQEVFIKAWQNLKKFDKNKSFKVWIFTIAKNTALDWLKKKKSVPFSAYDLESGENVLENTLEDLAPLPDEIADKKQAAEKLTEAVSALDAKYRAVLSLYYNNGFTFEEIAGVLKEPLNTVKSRHRRAVIYLRKILTET
jgi:RNA polymerase sigma-70 factor (ECF subfamily)